MKSAILAKIPQEFHLHFDRWVPQEYRLLSIVFLSVLAFHLLGIVFVRLEIPVISRVIKLFPTVTVFPLKSELSHQNWNAKLAFQFYYEDPSVMAFARTSDYLPYFKTLVGLQELKLDRELEGLVPSASIFISESSLEQTASTFLSNREMAKIESQLKKTEDDVPSIISSIIVGSELVDRIPNPLPVLQIVETDQPLQPTIVRIAVDATGFVKAALVITPSRKNVDLEAVKICQALKFKAITQPGLVWSDVVFYWPQSEAQTEGSF